MKHILLLEDNTALRETISFSLSSNQLKIFQAKNLNQSYQLLAKHKFDLAIIDRVLPDGDGLDLVDFIVHENSNLQILIISNKSEWLERFAGLKAGAIDYLAKPFHLEELQIKCQRIIKDENLANGDLKIGDLSLNFVTGLLSIGEYHSQLRKKETELLACLIRHKNYVITREKPK